MKTGDSKLLVGLLIGAVVGATVAYLATSDKKDQILDELSALADKVKEGYRNTISKYCDGKQAVGTETEVPAGESTVQ